MLASEVITVVRENLGDTVEDYRFDNTELLSSLTSATRKLAIDRPDLLINATGTITTIVDVTAVSDTLIFDRDWLEALVNYVCHLILIKDSESEQNMNLANFHLAKYSSLI